MHVLQGLQTLLQQAGIVLPGPPPDKHKLTQGKRRAVGDSGPCQRPLYVIEQAQQTAAPVSLRVYRRLPQRLRNQALPGCFGIHDLAFGECVP